MNDRTPARESEQKAFQARPRELVQSVDDSGSLVQLATGHFGAVKEGGRQDDVPGPITGMSCLDTSTVQRSGVMPVLQVVVNCPWERWWTNTVVSTAYPQGKPRDQEKLGRCGQKPPSRPLERVEPGSPFEVVKKATGIAPRTGKLCRCRRNEPCA